MSQTADNGNGENGERPLPQAILWIGLGVASWTADTAARLVDGLVHADFAYNAERLIRRGERWGGVGSWRELPWPLTRTPGNDVEQTLPVPATSPADVEPDLLTAVERRLANRSLPTRAEIDQLNRQIARLTAQIDQLTEGS
jgi:polyhydroxyalkanoate synthesis regulator phasin